MRKNKITMVIAIIFLMCVYLLIGLSNYWISKQQKNLVLRSDKVVKLAEKKEELVVFTKKRYGVDLFPPEIDVQNDPLNPVVKIVKDEIQYQKIDDIDNQNQIQEFSIDDDFLIR